MDVLPYGDSALLINFEQVVDDKINSQVIELSTLVNKLDGVDYTVPAYCSLTVGYNNIKTNFSQLSKEIKTLEVSNSKSQRSQRTVNIPVCYDSEYGLDLIELEELLDLSSKEIIKSHTEATYRVYMLGFVAGFAYMGALPEKLNSPRKNEPRLQVPKGSVGLAGLQTGIYPTDAPGGWQIIGRTPILTFDPAKELPAVLKPGDQIKFYSINKEEFESISTQVENGKYELEVSNA